MRYRIFCAALFIALLPACSSLQRLDYVCVDVDTAGVFTGTRARGKGVKLPDGETLTADLAQVLCGE
jgi:hypothetical protein